MRKIIGYKDFLAIPPGETKVFVCEDANSLRSAQVTAYSMRKLHPRPEVERYKLKVDWQQLLLTVEAIPKNNDTERSCIDS